MESTGIPRRCGICRFEISKGERVISVLLFDGSNSGAFRKGDFVLNNGCKQAGCHRTCSRHGAESVGCHYSCYLIAPHKNDERKSATLRYMLKTLHHAYEPPPSEEARRIRLLQKSLSPTVDAALPGLPHEIRRHIASFCISEPAAQMAADWYLSSDKCRPSEENVWVTRNDISFGGRDKQWFMMSFEGEPTVETLFDMSKPVYASYRNFEGVPYITLLTNELPRGQHELIQAPHLTEEAKVIYLAHDHLGLRHVITTGLAKALQESEKGDMWWETIPLPESDYALKCLTDGVKLRGVTLGEEESSIWTKALWPAPMPPSRPLRATSMCGDLEHQLDKYDGVLRMKPLNHRTGAITGLSVLWAGGPLSIHPHQRREDLAYYRLDEVGPVESAWLYLPLEEGETISEIYVHPPKDSFAPLAVCTNRGLVRVFGSHLRMQWDDFYLIDQQTDGESHQAYFGESDSGVKRLVLESPEPAKPHFTRPLERSVCPPSGEIAKAKMEEFFFSSAQLHGIVEVTPCESLLGHTAAITGLVLHYSDGHRECLGQVRLDHLLSPLTAAGSKAMWLGFSSTADGPCVRKVEFSRPEQSAELVWLEVSWSGTLEWWFSYRQCRVHYGQQASPETVVTRDFKMGWHAGWAAWRD